MICAKMVAKLETDGKRNYRISTKLKSRKKGYKIGPHEMEDLEPQNVPCDE